MNVNHAFSVTPAKVSDLLRRIERLGINTGVIEERFVKGGGKGGQKVNKTSNAVQLFYPPLSLTVKSHAARERSLNRFLALRELVDQIEMKISPQTSKRAAGWERIRKQKDRRSRRATGSPSI